MLLEPYYDLFLQEIHYLFDHLTLFNWNKKLAKCYKNSSVLAEFHQNDLFFLPF